jgi:hypothetical protein
MEEANILHTVASRCNHGPWIDIGSHTAWTSAHVASAGVEVDAIDNMYRVPEFLARAEENASNCGLREKIAFFGWTSDEYFQKYNEGLQRLDAPVGLLPSVRYAGCVVDGDHCRPHPLRDAMNAASLLDETGVIILHDFIGRDVQEAVEHLMDNGFNCRVYWTPHMVACCWRGDFTPPDHVRDPTN